MNPDIPSYEALLRGDSIDGMAMSVMAAGAVPPQEAFEYITNLKSVKSIIFGASSTTNIVGTVAVLRRLGWLDGQGAMCKNVVS